MEQVQEIGRTNGTAESLSREQVSSKLREVALFRGMETSDLDQILQISEPVLFEAGETVFEEGERGDHFFIIVRGAVELRKASGGTFQKLAVLRAGQAFGEMALLNQTPRSASAHAVEDAYMLSVSRAAFSRVLGGDSLAVRLLKNLSRALWATSVRLSAKRDQERDRGAQRALMEFNRLLRARLVPRVTPRVSGYDIAARTPPAKAGDNSACWDWFVLADGRPALAVMRSVKDDVFSAQRLGALRLLLRSAAAETHTTLGSLLSRVNRNLRTGWIEGLSGPLACGVLALSDGVAEWVGAGQVAGAIVRAGGTTDELSAGAPAVGEDADYEYHSYMVALGAGDQVVAFANGPRNATDVAASVLNGHPAGSKGALSELVELLNPADSDPGTLPPVTAALIARTHPAPVVVRGY